MVAAKLKFNTRKTVVQKRKSLFSAILDANEEMDSHLDLWEA